MALFCPQVCDAEKLVAIKSRFVLEMQTILQNATGIKELYEQAQAAAAPEAGAAASVSADAAPQGAHAVVLLREVARRRGSLAPCRHRFG
jgi:hypothetical protein